jgi:hypothetical protein
MPSTLSPDDLDAAVKAGVIDAAQAEKLRAMRAAEGADADTALADEEHFRFLNGFNDIFLTIGVLLIAGALLFAATPQISTSIFGTMAFAAIVFWILSEILVRRLRAVLPGIVLSVLFVVFAAAAAVIQYHSSYDAMRGLDVYSEMAFWRNPTLLFAAPALLASLIYYLRFRLPFALALVAFFGYFVVNKGVLALTGKTTPLIALAFGLAVLAVALFYDTRDPRRRSRLSDCAFWLHLVAAPLIVSPVIMLIKSSTAPGVTSVAVLLTVLALGFFALAIDRRALLVSSLAYFAFAVYDLLAGHGLITHSTSATSTIMMTLAFVGGFVLVLGVFWRPLRRLLWPLLQNSGLASYLPPAGQ